MASLAAPPQNRYVFRRLSGLRARVPCLIAALISAAGESDRAPSAAASSVTMYRPPKVDGEQDRPLDGGHDI